MSSGARPCVFCQIVAAELPASKVFESAELLGFLDARPLFKGHVLVVPKRHIATLGELDPVGPFFFAVQQVASALEVGLAADGSFVAINNKVSQSVPHLHAHVVPRRRGDGLRGFFWPRQRYESDAEREDYARRIRESLPPSL